jgi:hypothetical protein
MAYDDRRAALDLRLPVRAAFTFRDGIRNVGYVFGPLINLDLRWPRRRHLTAGTWDCWWKYLFQIGA